MSQKVTDEEVYQVKEIFAAYITCGCFYENNRN